MAPLNVHITMLPLCVGGDDDKDKDKCKSGWQDKRNIL